VGFALAHQYRTFTGRPREGKTSLFLIGWMNSGNRDAVATTKLICIPKGIKNLGNTIIIYGVVFHFFCTSFFFVGVSALASSVYRLLLYIHPFG
jgi:hypothetical protein